MLKVAKNDKLNIDSTKNIKFEDALARLEQIVHTLEEGDIGLNESLEKYEEGVKLLRQSYELLEKAERRIELLSGVDAEGNPVTEPFDHKPTIEKDDTTTRRGLQRSLLNKKAKTFIRKNKRLQHR